MLKRLDPSGICRGLPKEYEATIQQALRRIGNVRQIDALGFIREDYEAELRLHAWRVYQRLVKRSEGRPISRQYVHKSIWNQAKWLKRQLKVKRRQIMEQRQIRFRATFDAMPTFEAREGLRLLKERVTPSDLKELLEAACSNSKARTRQSRDRIYRVRRRARLAVPDLFGNK